MNAKTEFKFSDENMIKVHEIIKKYPKGKERSAVMPLLYLVQEQNDNWIPTVAMDYVAELLGIPPMQVYEVANFYTMYNKKPVGKNLIQICRTTPCWLCGSNEIVKACKKELGIDIGETTEDGLFSIVEVECLGACTAAPMMQINDDYYENLTEDKTVEIIRNLKGS
jgi:NADH-quinone oxidoreductase subunit E